MTTLISFLGKGRADAKSGYRTATYHFGDGILKTVNFFGLALQEYLQPQRLILVGTAGSMWDVFFERGGADEELLALMDAVEQQRVDEAMLTRHAKRLEQELGVAVDCLLIPFARDTAEQIAVLRGLAAMVTEGETVSIDVTHSFRHLPMLALVAARYLAHVSKVRVEELYYGALEMTANNVTPVLRLSGLLKMLDWVEALATYDKDGDYGVFAPLLEDDGMEPGRAKLLAKAAFFERTSNPVKAREALSSVFPSVDAHRGELGSLFKDALSQRINWFRQPARHDWEASLALENLDRSDFVRATTFLFESVSTRAVMTQKLGDPNDYSLRAEAYDNFSKNHPEAKRLEYLRNALAHGSRRVDEAEAKALSSPESLADTLRRYAKKLLQS